MCDGVLIAQEMILELESQGEEVGFFAILDTWVLENSQIRPLWAVDYYLYRLRTFPKLRLDEQLSALRRVVQRLARRNRSPRSEWPETYWPGENFQPPRFRAPVVLFKRPRQPYYYVRDPHMGWGDRSTGGIEICEVDCGHYEMLRQPYVRLIAEKLTARLREVNERIRSRDEVSPA
jgi:thioesterase domain-containing protein